MYNVFIRLARSTVVYSCGVANYLALARGSTGKCHSHVAKKRNMRRISSSSSMSRPAWLQISQTGTKSCKQSIYMAKLRYNDIFHWPWTTCNKTPFPAHHQWLGCSIAFVRYLSLDFASHINISMVSQTGHCECVLQSIANLAKTQVVYAKRGKIPLPFDMTRFQSGIINR
jgi:hypothetical protein